MKLCTALASRVVKATSAASHAVIRCDAELRRARRVVDAAGSDDAAALAALDASVQCDAASLAALQAATRYEALAQGANANHSADATTPAQLAREAAARCDVDGAAAASRAAMAALDASVRCDAASLAALQAATRYEALAQGGNANHSADATTPAQLAREAAARCDVDGAAAASRVANAFADSCAAACGDAERLTLAAGEAAARCVLARDDAATAFLVARQATITTRRHLKAFRESADSHKEARKDAVAAALAVRESAVRCAAASRRAVLAASTARKIASRCEAAAASKAREAAAGCDLALADAIEDADKEFVDKMRGWLMTVATLFVGIAFQALLHPPDGMSFDILVSKNARNWKAGPGAPSPAPNLAPSSAATVVNATPAYDWVRAFFYLSFNTSIMAFALFVLVSLLTMKKATFTHSLLQIKAMAMTLAIAVVGSVVTGTSRNLGVQLNILGIFGMYGFILLIFVKLRFLTFW
ncbi:hypothetical protein TRIUR3_08046 [Triticum urartu]|uniref:PGG domain-containing protein n=1 Tax=Triticum urartu TaxID=4572 RepID=M8AC77_TRIUA|nr:hypothetical protein TRIUR3_08046 [Triticum urartu]